MREEWIEVKIKDASDSFAGGTPSRAISAYFGGPIPWISSGEVNASFIDKTKETITELGLINSSAKLIPNGAVLIAMYGATAGQVSKLKIRATSNQAVLAIITNPKVLDSDLLYYLLNFRKDSIIFLAQGSGQPNLSKALIDNQILKIPKSLTTQQKIAHILNTLDGLIARTEDVIAKYTALKAGLLQDLFTRGIDETGQLRPSPHEASDLYKESELGLIPKEWDVKKFDKVTNLIIDGTHFTPKYVEHGVPFLRVTDVHETILNPANFKYVTTEEHTFLIKRCRPEKGDILYSKNGTIGVAKLVDWDFEFSIFVSLALIKPKHDCIDKYYLLHLLRHDVIYDQIRKRSKQGTVTNLHLEEIREFDIPLPSKNEQLRIAERIERISSNIETEQTYLTKLQGIWAGLMADLLSGNLDLSTIIL